MDAVSTIEASAASASGPAASRSIDMDRLQRWAAGGVLYAVLDACDAPAVPSVVKSLGPDRGTCLYQGHAAENFGNKAPYFVRVDSALLAWIAQLPEGQPWGCFAASTAGFAALRHHLRKFLTVASPEGERWLFRYYDPRLLPIFLSSCSAEELNAFFGPVDVFVVGHPKEPACQAYYRPPESVAASAPRPVGERFRLREAHVAAFRRKSLGDALVRTFAGTAQTARRDPDDGDIVVTDPGGHELRLAFDLQGFVGGVTSPSGRTWRLENDATGKLSALTLPSGLRTQIDYAAAGVMTTLRRDGQERLRVEHDEQGRLQTLAFADGTRATVRYRDTGPPGFRDEADRFVAALTDRLNRVERFDYDGDELAAFTDGNGHTTRFEYGQWRRPDAAVYPDGSRETYRHDLQGRLAALAYAGGTEIALAYDDAGRLARMTASDGSESTFVYDAKGRLTEARNSECVLAYRYDDAGRLVEERQDQTSVRYVYDAAGTLVGLGYPTGETIAYERDADLRLSAFTDWTGRRYSMEYAGNDAGWCLAAPDGLIIAARQNPVGLTTSVTVRHTSAPDLGWQTHYAYDAEDRLGERADSRLGTRRYVYDAEGQLLAVRGDSSLTSEAFAYDGAGNRVASNGQTAVCNALNQLLTQGDTRCVYDTRGNLAEKATPVTRWRYVYDGFNRLVHAEDEGRHVVRFHYDAFGRRVCKESTVRAFGAVERSTITRYVWVGEQLIREVSQVTQWPDAASQAGFTEHAQDYLYWPQTHTPLLLREGETVYQYHTDPLGVPRRVTDVQGRIVWEADYAAFGQARVLAHRVRQPWRLPGQYADEETGLYYNRHRYYDSALGRYISRDPVSYLGGLNLYCYCGNNPVNEADPLGLWWKAALSIVAAVAVGALVVATAPISGPLLIIAAGAAAGAVGFGLNEALNQEHFCLACILGAAAKGALVGAAASLPFAWLPATAGVGLFAAAGAGSGAIGYLGDWLLSGAHTEQWSWGRFALAVGIGAATAGLGRWLIPKVGNWWRTRGSNTRLPQDVAVDPNPPQALPLNRPVGLSPTQNAQVQADIAAARAQGATDFRVNQQQVNAAGQRVGTNRPDLQYTDANGRRVYVEYDTPASTRGPAHQQRILSNDPNGDVILKTVP